MSRTEALARTVAMLVLSSVPAAAQATGPLGTSPLSDEAILDRPKTRLRVESVMTRVTAFDQYGHGYQSQAGPTLGPGSERATILEPQVEIVASQGSRIEHRIWVPIDVVTAASPDAVDKTRVDAISSASRQNTAGTLAWRAKYRLDRDSDVAIDSGLHVEEPFRSWHGGLSGTRAIDDGGTVFSGTLLEVFDWFDNFDIQGYRGGRTNRSSTTLSFGATRILTPTTLVIANYGLTVQAGELGNTWNSVPLTNGKRGPEILPTERIRHALVLRTSQYLPWDGALHLYYRFYHDDWGLSAHSIEAVLLQRILPILYVGATYRFHTQTGVDFFTTRAPLDHSLRTADSDLAPLDADTFGGRIAMDLPVSAAMRLIHFDFAYERYVRTNDLRMTVVTWATGYRF
jgi:hypothetical protein